MLIVRAMANHGDPVDQKSDRDSEERIAIGREELRVDKISLMTGKVRVTTSTDYVEELATATLASVEVEVTEVPVGREVTTVPTVRVEGDVTIVPIVEEILIVEKRLVLARELHIARKPRSETVEMPVTLRRQTASVERVADDTERGD